MSTFNLAQVLHPSELKLILVSLLRFVGASHLTDSSTFQRGIPYFKAATSLENHNFPAVLITAQTTNLLKIRNVQDSMIGLIDSFYIDSHIFYNPHVQQDDTPANLMNGKTKNDPFLALIP
jgi:hypothetical protein